MNIIVQATAEAAAEHVHDLMVAHLQAQPVTVLGLPTGATPLPVYERLVRSHQSGAISWRGVTTFNLDEYICLGRDHPASYAAYMRRALFDHVDCPQGQQHIPDGLAPDPVAEALSYEASIAKAGGLDLLLLGIGRNAHIGFNEPGSDFASRTRPVDLTPSTLAANAPFFAPGETPPARAISMGIATILEARRIIVLATGTSKAQAVQRSVAGPATPDFPGSALQSVTDVTIVLDQAAAALL